MIVEQIRNDMPKENRQLDTIKMSLNEYMLRFDKIKTLGDRAFIYILIENSSGLPIAYTETWFFSSQRDLATQGDTGVLHDYRGKKLGIVLKYKMLDKILADPRNASIFYWGTTNASSNLHMIRINTELDYKVNGIWNVYEYSRENLENILSK